MILEGERIQASIDLDTIIREFAHPDIDCNRREELKRRLESNYETNPAAWIRHKCGKALGYSYLERFFHEVNISLYQEQSSK